MSKITIGEIIAARKFDQDTRSGEARYVPGQHKARMIGKSDAVVTYVDREGCAMVMPVEKVNGEWYTREVIFRVGMRHAEVRFIPRQAPLSDDIMRALQEVKQPRSPAGQTT